MENAARARLDGWKQSLLAAAEHLLDAADHGIPVAGDPVRLVFSLVGGSRYLIEPADAAGLEAGRIRVALPAAELAAKVAGLRRAARDALADGEHVLWLAIGVLEWTAGERTRAAPLVLWPMTLDRDAAGVTRLVVAADRTPRLNSVLAAHLRAEHGIELEQPGPIDLVRALDHAVAIAAEHPGWRVLRSCRLGTFAFAPHELAASLDDATLAASAPIRWLAGDAPPPALASSPDELVTPLDADASQVAALSAAAAGASFVLQAAPGTGKTQTIANLVAQCASRGTSLLVVAEHKATLHAIRERLDGVGLAELCSPSRPSRPQLVPGSGPTVGRTRLAEVTARLDRHVAAMHGGHGLGLSIHDVLARLVELRTIPNAALEELDAPSLDRATFERRKRAATELAAATAAVEPAATHPWRASALDAWHDGLAMRAANALDLAGEASTALASAVVELAVVVPHVVTRTSEQLATVGKLAELAASSPRPGAELLAAGRGRSATADIGERVALIRARGGGTLETPRDPAAFVAIAQRHRALVAEVAETFAEPPELDASELWAQLKRWTASVAPLRYVALRTARAAVQAAALPGALASDEAMLVALEAVIAERACRTALEAAAEPARRWFGELGGDPLTIAVEPIEAALAWAGELRRAFDQVAIAGGESARQTAWRALVAQITVTTGADRADLVPFARLADAVARYQPTLAFLAEATGIPLVQLGAGHDHLAVVRTQVDALARSVRALGDWTRYTLAKRAAVDAGLRSILVAAERGDLAAADLALAWERATLLAWIASAIGRAPELVRFDGGAHHVAVTSFADLDRGAMAVARGRLQRHAPCALVTPAELARGEHAELGEVDLVVFEDASSLPIAHALGALARCKAAIVVGDTRQPGTKTGEPSMLDAALAAGFPQLQLGAHYASRHHDLFAFANDRYYAGRISVLPAARAGGAISWRHVDGCADELGANRAEAEAIVAEVVQRCRSQSIAVACLSRAQQQLIEDLLDDERVKDRALVLDRVSVVTPDRLQGTRDVVLVSVGDAADSLGALAHPGAERWLAALVTHARDHLIVASSFAPEAVAIDAPPAWRGLAQLIGLARAGGAPFADDTAPTSPVTAAIARALVERGWTVRHGVGSVELAVVDPDDPARCVLAIEHDGGAYARTMSARDRDRLRAQELVRLGWRVHRVWALDWWLDPERETQRAHGAIVAAVAAGRRARTTTPPAVSRIVAPIAAVAAKAVRRRIAAGSTAPVETAAAAAPPIASGSGPTTAPLHLARGAIAIGPYIAAAIPPGRRIPDDMFGGRHHGELAKVVEQVLAAEAPIHLELLARRVGAYFGVGRVTPEVVAQVRAALDGRGMFADEPDVVWRVDQDPAGVPTVRVAGATSVAHRDIAQIPLFEIAAAARIVVERAVGVPASQLARDTSRLLGFARVTPRITERVEHGIRLAALRELISLDEGRATLVTA